MPADMLEPTPSRRNKAAYPPLFRYCSVFEWELSRKGIEAAIERMHQAKMSSAKASPATMNMPAGYALASFRAFGNGGLSGFEDLNLRRRFLPAPKEPADDREIERIP